MAEETDGLSEDDVIGHVLSRFDAAALGVGSPFGVRDKLRLAFLAGLRSMLGVFVEDEEPPSPRLIDEMRRDLDIHIARLKASR